MKRTAIIFALALAVINVHVNKTPCELAEAVLRSQSNLPDMLRVSPKDSEFGEWLEDYYHVEPGQVSDGVIYYADGAEASEIAILVLGDSLYGDAVSEALTAYIKERAAVFRGYAPVQADIAGRGLVVLRDGYAALLILPDARAARAAFLECLDEQKGRAEALELTDGYNHDEVLRAFRTGDKSALSRMNREILEAAERVIRTEIHEGMTDYDKELAMHDWITHHSTFDYSIFRRSGKIEDGSDTPYGVLVKHSAMCHGYSSTFQLLMDMLNIECITVWGRADGRGVRHSWNMVHLGGEWYCVDCAWDDPIGGSPSHKFFNVTSNYLRRSGIHDWDSENVPEAEGSMYSFR